MAAVVVDRNIAFASNQERSSCLECDLISAMSGWTDNGIGVLSTNL